MRGSVYANAPWNDAAPCINAWATWASVAPLARRNVASVITLVRLARVLVILVLALLAISFVMGVGTPTTGPVEKALFLLLIGGCVYAAAKVTAFSEWLVHRLARG